MTDPKPPTEEELSRWVITGTIKRQDLAQRLGRCVMEIRRLRVELVRAEREGDRA
jgi:hypothetical protein